MIAIHNKVGIKDYTQDTDSILHITGQSSKTQEKDLIELFWAVLD